MLLRYLLSILCGIGDCFVLTRTFSNCQKKKKKKKKQFKLWIERERERKEKKKLLEVVVEYCASFPSVAKFKSSRIIASQQQQKNNQYNNHHSNHHQTPDLIELNFEYIYIYIHITSNSIWFFSDELVQKRRNKTCIDIGFTREPGTGASFFANSHRHFHERWLSYTAAKLSSGIAIIIIISIDSSSIIDISISIIIKWCKRTRAWKEKTTNTVTSRLSLDTKEIWLPQRKRTF